MHREQCDERRRRAVNGGLQRLSRHATGSGTINIEKVRCTMFERYTERARRVLFFARYEAGRAGSPAIATEHLLLGLLRERRGTTAQIFARAALSFEGIGAAIRGRARQEHLSAPVESGFGLELPLSAETRRVLQLAAEEADQLKHAHIGDEHLLLGILGIESSAATSILMERGMRLDAVRNLVQRGAEETPLSPGVRIAPTRRAFEQGTSGGRDMVSWTLNGFGLRPVLSQVYGIPETRIELPADLDDDQRYDCSAVLAPSDLPDVMDRLMQEGIERHFQVTVTRETRRTDVYVLSAPNGLAAAKESDGSDGGSVGLGFTVNTMDELVHDASLTEEDLRKSAVERLKAFAAGGRTRRHTIQSISASIGMEGLCEMLEQGLDRPVIDETNLSGAYRLDVRTDARTNEGFLRALQDQLGLVATSAVRDVPMLVVRR